jgi:hypothetical protein
MLFSSDGGLTWNENAPEDYNVIQNADGSIIVKGK